MTEITPSILLSARERSSELRFTDVNQQVIHRVAIIALMLFSAAFLFALGAFRHNIFRSGALDLGFFDQLVYLISRGQRPVSSILGYHALGDHAAFNLY